MTNLEKHYSEHPNIVIMERDFQLTKYMNVDREKENEDAVVAILLCYTRLKEKEVEFVVVNNVSFTRESFEFKNGRFNSSLAIRVLTNQYYIKELEETKSDLTKQY